VPFYERQPYIQPLYLVVSEVMRGEIRIPRFQRPGTETTWSPEQRGDLLDSLYRGFPIGTILLWSTGKQIATLDRIGGFRIPRSSTDAGQRLLLDGHQRLSTLVQVLGPGLEGDLKRSGAQVERQSADEPVDREQWVFELDPAEKAEESRERFILLRSGQNPTPTQLPLAIALDRTALNKWIRDRKEPLSDNQIAEADALRDRLREYSIPVAVLVANSLREATESFKRINSSGAPMSDFNMVAALAYQDGFDPQEVFERYRGKLLEPLGWQGVSDTDILRVCAGLAGQPPANFKVDRIASWLREQGDAIEQAFNAIVRTAEKLGRLCGIRGPEALPYSWQLITLAICLGGERDELPEEDDAVRRWLWLTTYGEVFAGVNSAIYARSRKALDEMMQGGDWTAMERDVTRKVRPPQRFDFRAARSKASALAMARHQDKDDTEDAAHRALAKGVTSMGLLQPSGRRSTWWHLMVIPEGHSISEYREALKQREKGMTEADAKRRLEIIGVPEQAQGSITDLLRARRDVLLQREAEFVKGLGLEWAER
jgi:hypothetical protein